MRTLMSAFALLAACTPASAAEERTASADPNNSPAFAAIAPAPQSITTTCAEAYRVHLADGEGGGPVITDVYLEARFPIAELSPETPPLLSAVACGSTAASNCVEGTCTGDVSVPTCSVVPVDLQAGLVRIRCGATREFQANSAAPLTASGAHATYAVLQIRR